MQPNLLIVSSKNSLRLASWIWLILPLVVWSQPTTHLDLDFDRPDTIQRAYSPIGSRNFIFIASKFASDEVVSGARLDSLSDFQIQRIDLVYSLYHKSGNFNQTKLNDSRWDHLIQQYPALFTSGSTHFHNICQVQENDSLAKRLRHGFYVFFENRVEPVSRKSEIEALIQMAIKAGLDVSDTTDGYFSTTKTIGDESTESIEIRSSKAKYAKRMRAKDPRACRQPYYETGLEDLNNFIDAHLYLKWWQKWRSKKYTGTIRLRISYTGEIKQASIASPSKRFAKRLKKLVAEMNSWNPAVRNGIAVNSIVKIKIRYFDGKFSAENVEVPRNLLKCPIVPDDELFDFSAPVVRTKFGVLPFTMSDADLLKKVMARIPNADSIGMAIDLTGSMGPYMAQALELSTEIIQSGKPTLMAFALFNDGNGLMTRDKVIGKTGGINLLTHDITPDRLISLAIKTMQDGSGGDAPENNVEAVLALLNTCEDCKTVLVICDNQATPRDIRLANQINKTVHWVICGTGPLNPDYLTLARNSRGILHTYEATVSGLHLLQEGEIVTVAGVRFRLSGGKFRRLTN